MLFIYPNGPKPANENSCFALCSTCPFMLFSLPQTDEHQSEERQK